MHSRRSLTVWLALTLTCPLLVPIGEVGAAKKKAVKKKGGGANAPAPAPASPAPATNPAPSASSTAEPASASAPGAAAAVPATPAGAQPTGPSAAPTAAPTGKGTAPAPTKATAPVAPAAAQKGPASGASSATSTAEPALASSPEQRNKPTGSSADSKTVSAAGSTDEAALRTIELAREGQRDYKEGRLDAALIKLRQAADDADRASLSGNIRAQIHLLYAWALRASGDTAAAQKQAEQAADLDPDDAEVRRDVAELQQENGQSQAAADSAQRALDLGLRGHDADDMRALAAKGQPTGFRARFRLEAGLSVGFDSNVAQGDEYQTIAGKSTRGAAKNQGARLSSVRIFRALREDPLLGSSVYQRAVVADYQTAQAAQAQAGMPLDISLSARYRLLTAPNLGLSVGYQFAQLFMVVAEGAANNLLPAAETYHLQRHTATVIGQLRPKPWLDISAHLDGFITLSGLQQFTPFQGGLVAAAHGVITESSRWHTHVDASYLFRQSFDQANDGYLNGHRVRILLGQELRLGWLRPMLAYRFTYDATGVLQVQAPLPIMYASSAMPTDPPIAADVGTYSYSAPLSYQGHQLSASTSLALPLQISAQAAVRYEFQLYSGPYSAVYVGNAVGAIAALPPFALSDVQRADHRLAIDLSASKELPHHLGVGLAYGLLANFSNVANALDNRSFSKHSLIASVSYYY